jgi:hypothetical protein
MLPLNGVERLVSHCGEAPPRIPRGKAKRKAVWFNGDDEGIGSVGAGN